MLCSCVRSTSVSPSLTLYPPPHTTHTNPTPHPQGFRYHKILLDHGNGVVVKDPTECGAIPADALHDAKAEAAPGKAPSGLPKGHGFTVTIPVRYRSIEVSVYPHCCALVELLPADCASSGGLDPYPPLWTSACSH